MTTSMEQSSCKPVLELCEDNLIEILHRLPSKSLSRFESVCKHWGKCIDDPSIAYSCRSQRWSPQPYMMGFFCQGRDEVDEQNRFFFSSKKSSQVIDGSLDDAVGVSDGVLYYALCNRREITLWYLESNIRSTNDAVWVIKYVVNITSALLNCPEVIGSIRIKMLYIDIHSVNPHIFYLLVGDKVISYDSEKNTAEFLYEIGVSVWTANQYYLFFSYEWHQWPRLLRTHQLEEE
ncbi:hypothetical protein KY285_022502 [Solanum tuberosum]|nr:hypothetical protein KY289_021919 [Solanum tuberosum]KAH0695405.1 hypothetical protein KY285_022502 [Solanum tuberosum]